MITRSNLFMILALTAITALFVAVLFSRGASQSGATTAIPPVNKTSPTGQELTSSLAALKNLGIPIKQVSILSESPMEVRITLQSTSQSEVATADDMWNKHIAARWAELAYLTGPRVDSYQLHLANAKGNIIGSEKVFLNSDYPSQHLTAVEATAVDDAAVLAILREQLDFLGMTPTRWNVVTGGVVRDNTKVIEVDLSTPNVETANRTINLLVPSVSRVVHRINAKTGAQIAIFRLKVIDASNRVLIDYILDLETGTEVWLVERGVDANWYPKPAPTRARPTPTS